MIIQHHLLPAVLHRTDQRTDLVHPRPPIYLVAGKQILTAAFLHVPARTLALVPSQVQHIHTQLIPREKIPRRINPTPPPENLLLAKRLLPRPSTQRHRSPPSPGATRRNPSCSRSARWLDSQIRTKSSSVEFSKQDGQYGFPNCRYRTSPSSRGIPHTAHLRGRDTPRYPGQLTGQIIF